MNSISNWNNFPVIHAEVTTPFFQEEMRGLLNASAPTIARGNGRCYGDASLGNNIVSTLALNHALGFDEINGVFSCQSGMLLSDILEIIVPRGWYLPVTPGTKYITVGGAFASDVHGKNHHKEGSFSDYVIKIKLIKPNGEVEECSPEVNPTLFWFTAGGMGLTGIILEVTFTLKKIASPFIKQRQVRAGSLDEIIELFDVYKHYTYSVAWIDCLKRGRSFGRSILMVGEHASKEEALGKRFTTARNLSVPFFFPSFSLNPLTIKAFNAFFYAKNYKQVMDSVISSDSFFYPLDSILGWNKIYGKRGFIQYQFVVPRDIGKKAITDILKRITEKGWGSFLAVLKAFGPGTVPLTFQMEGYTLALDIPMNANLLTFLDVLDELVKDYGGRIYLSKDARMKPEIFFSTYPRSSEFSEYVAVNDPQGIIQSRLSKRLTIK
jgi:decaprenylphospho-beta-D-ribofuranose 2-oxidase